MADQYWLKPKRIHSNDKNTPRGWWYAEARGAIRLYTGNGTPLGSIKASDLRNFLNMLDHHKPRKRRA